MIDLTGRLALVTGGSRGIGRACALKLAEAGADVVVNYLTSQAEANSVAEQIQGMGREAVTIKADVSEPEDVQEMMGFLAERFEHLDCIVSNAAAGGFHAAMETKPSQFDVAMRTNAQALLVLAQAARPLLVKSSRPAKVIAISSHGSQFALANYAAVGASKAALESLVRHLALELGPQGINFNVVLAGLVKTAAVREMPGLEAVQEDVRRIQLVNEELTPEAVADVVLFLASSLSDMVQGSTVVVDGGVSIRV